MNANVTKNNMTKVMAAIMVMAVVVAGVAMISSDSVDAADGDITYLSGTITSSQVFDEDTVVVVDRDLTIPENMSLETSGKLTVNEGVTVTVSKGGQFIINEWASVTVDGAINVAAGGVLVNSAQYDATNMVGGSYCGFFVNGELNIAREGKLITDAAPVNTAAAVGTANDKFVGHVSVDADMGNEIAQATVLTTKVSETAEDYDLCITTDSAVTYHHNGAGNEGYWVGFAMTGLNAGDNAVISYEGRNSSVRDTVDENGNLYIYVEAGRVTDITITIGNQITTLTVDTTRVAYENNIDSRNGVIIVGENGVISVDSNSKRHGEMMDQMVLMNAGATASIKGDVWNVKFESIPTDKTNPYAAAYIWVDSQDSRTAEKTNKYTELDITVSTENLGDVIVNGEENTRGTNYILNISGEPYNTDIETATVKAMMGTATCYIPNEDGESTGIAMQGTVVINGDMTIGAGSELDINGNTVISGSVSVDGSQKDGNATLLLEGIIEVTGTMDVGQYADVNAASAYLKVTGEAQFFETLPAFDGINGVTYEVENSNNDTYVHVTTLASAIENVANAEDGLTVHGYIDEAGVLDAPYVIDADVTVDGYTMYICGTAQVAEGVTLTISDNGELLYDDDSEGSLIIVKGTVTDYTYADFAYSQTEITGAIGIDAEVRSTDADETYYSYTTLANALANTESGTIELFGNVTVDGTMTIKAGVTVDMMDRAITVEKGAELIVDGILEANNQLDIEKATNQFETDGKVTVNNYIVGDVQNYIADIAGFYTYGTIGDYTNADFIMSGVVAAENSAVINDINVYGEVTVTDLTFTAGDTNYAVITVNGALSAGTITLDGYTFNIEAGALYNGSVANAEGAVSFTNVTGTVTVADVTVDDADRLTIVGTPGVAVVEKENVDSVVAVSNGTVYVTGTLNLTKMQIKDGTYAFSVAEGTTVTVDGGNISAGTIAVAGTLDIQTNNALANGTSLNVTGTVAVKEATANTAGATLNVDDLYVGTTAEDIAKGVAAGTGTVTGDVRVSGTAYVTAGSEVPESVTDASNIGVTEFYLEDTLWLTVYGTTASVTNAPAENADFLGWNNADGDEVYNVAESKNIALTGVNAVDALYANVDYEIYSVYIYADNGIGTVAVDGIVLPKISNMYFMDGLTAGNHTISVELKNGYTGDVVMSVGGTTVSGLTFTLSGTEPADREVNITLSGPTASTQDPIVIDQGSGDGMGVTDYLLIILVILVIVLAIFVALRMMRS